MANKIEEKISEKLNRIKVKDIMTRSVMTTHEDETLSDLADLLIRTKISGVPVIKDNIVSGIITTTDLLKLMGQIKEGAFAKTGASSDSNPTVKMFMTRNVSTVTEENSLADIVDIMCAKNIHTLPVVRDNKLVGIVGRRDMIMYFYAALRDSIQENKT